jgi:hypothetical protein
LGLLVHYALNGPSQLPVVVTHPNIAEAEPCHERRLGILATSSGVLGLVSPTVFRARGLRFFFSREEERMHIHVLGEEGEAKFWVEPRIELARNHGLSEKSLSTAMDLITERYDEIRTAWHEHFGR